MLNVLLIDDEPSAIKIMELMLMDFDNIHIAGMYTSSEKALTGIEKDKPDAVFVDIEMPGKNGLDIAGELAEKYNGIDVVFVTAYNQYAVSAFEASAVDYLLKPVRKERLEKTIARLEKMRRREDDAGNGRGQVSIQCFRRFTIHAPPGTAIRWRTKKVEELAAFLVHNRHRQLSREIIISFLWPETEAEKANVLFHTTLYNLKKALGVLGQRVELKKEAGGYRLQLNNISCDVDDFEKTMDFSGQHDDGAQILEKLFSIYTGGYFEEDGYLWAENKRFEFESKLIALCMKLSKYYKSKVLWEKTADVLRSILRIDTMNQAAYEMLVVVYSKLGNTGLMIQTHCQYKSTLEELGIAPKALEELIKSI